MPSLSRKEIICAISQATGYRQTVISPVVDALLVEITKGLQAGRKVKLRGFGIWEKRQRRQGVGRNPNKPEAGEIIIPPCQQVKFIAGLQLKTAIN